MSLALDTMVRDVYLGPIQRELPEGTTLHSELFAEEWTAFVRTGNVYSWVSIGARDLDELAQGGLIGVVHRKLRSLALRHFAAWSVGAFPGWRI